MKQELAPPIDRLREAVLRMSCSGYRGYTNIAREILTDLLERERAELDSNWCATFWLNRRRAS